MAIRGQKKDEGRLADVWFGLLFSPEGEISQMRRPLLAAKLISFWLFLVKNQLEKRSICAAAHREKTCFLLQHLVSSLQWQPMFTTHSSIFCASSSPAWKGHPSSSSQLNLLAVFSFLSLSEADWSWTPRGLQETVSEPDLRALQYCRAS